MSYKIGEAATVSGGSVKTLHHYDAIGLLIPSGRTEARYQLYPRNDLFRLQQILFYRMLEFPLEEIHRLMTDPEFDRTQALEQQKRLLTEKADRLHDVIGLIDQVIAEKNEDITMSLKRCLTCFRK